MAQETVTVTVSSRLAYMDDDEDGRENEPAADERGGSASTSDDLPNADALLSLEAPAKQERDLEQPSPASRLLSDGVPADAPTSAPYDLGERHDDLVGGDAQPWSFDNADGGEHHLSPGNPYRQNPYTAQDPYAYRGGAPAADPYGYRGGAPAADAYSGNPYGAPAQQPMGGQPGVGQPGVGQPGYVDPNYQPASFSFWNDPYAARPNPYAQQQPVAPQQQGMNPMRYQPSSPQDFAAAVGYATGPAQQGFTPAPQTAAGHAAAGAALYVPTAEAADAPDLQAVSYPTRRSANAGTHAPANLPASTGPIWAIALLPLVMLVLGLLFLLSGSAGKLSGTFAAVMLIGPYLLGIVLAIADRAALQRMGYEHTAHWGWAFLTAPAYLIVRMANVVRETGRGFGPLLSWVAVTIITAVAIIAVPGIVMALAPATFAAEAEAAIRSDAAVMGANLVVDCPDVPPLIVQETMVCTAVSDTKIQDLTVSLQRENGWIGWRVDDWGIWSTNR